MYGRVGPMGRLARLPGRTAGRTGHRDPASQEQRASQRPDPSRASKIAGGGGPLRRPSAVSAEERASPVLQADLRHPASPRVPGRPGGVKLVDGGAVTLAPCLRAFAPRSPAEIRATKPLAPIPGIFAIPVTPLVALRVLSVVAWLGLIVVARRRHPMFARFVAVLIGVHTALACSIAAYVPMPWLAAYAYLHFVVYAHFFALARPRMRPTGYRWFVSLPASYFSAATLLSLPVLPVVLLGGPAWILALPHVIAAFGMWQSLTTHRELVHLELDRAPLGGIARFRAAPAKAPGRALRIAQLSDTHLGPFMTVERLRACVQRAVDGNPDLVLLTGDFLTMESQATHEYLARALEPLRALPGRAFACPGNHDHEAPEVVTRALESAGVRYLVDEAVVVPTAVGSVQLVGMDFVWRGRPEHLQRVCAEYPRLPGVPRIVLLHDPGAFRHLPEGEGDLVLSGHTHGGQVGLVSLGLDATLLRAFVDMPDHGLWSRGRDRLYVHTGTGHYGFPLRLGVPAREPEIAVWWPGLEPS